MAGSRPLRPFRDTARGIVVRGQSILLMERWRPGMHYFSIPGGGIEDGETAEETVVREIKEETTVDVKVAREIVTFEDAGYKHHIYLCDYLQGDPHLPSDAPEAAEVDEDNRFKPGWVNISELDQLPFTYWEPVRRPLIDGLQNGFPTEPVTVTAGV